MAGGSLGDGRGEWWRLVGGDGSGDGVVSGGGKMGALGAMRPPWRGVSLGCLEPDFMDHNRELTPAGAAAALAICGDGVRVASSRLAAELRSEIELTQRGEHPQQRKLRDDGEERKGQQAARSAGGKASVLLRGLDSLSGLARECRIAHNRQRAEDSLVAVQLHPSGFFSLLHGMVKPLMHTMRKRRVLLTRAYLSSPRALRHFALPRTRPYVLL